MQTHPSAIAAGIPIKRVEYQYDADSRRIARAEPVWDSANATFQPDPSPTRYIWKNWTLLAEFTLEASISKITKTYLWGLDLAESLDQTSNVGNLLAILDPTGPTPITLLPTYDSNGNIISLADAATATKAITYEYDAFGQQVIKTNHAALENKPAALIEAVERNQWSFSTKPEDPTTGLHYYGYRFYDSCKGRWINRDPIEEEGGINLYGFVGNDGINYTDINGLYIHPLESYARALALFNQVRNGEIDDKLAHCMAHCMLSSGLFDFGTSHVAGAGKEILDQLFGGGWDTEDMNVNADGRECGNPTMNATKCKCCCEEAGH